MFRTSLAGIATMTVAAALIASPATAYADCDDPGQDPCTGPVPTVDQVVAIMAELTDPNKPTADKTDIVTPGFSPDEAQTINDHLNEMNAKGALPLNFVVTDIQPAPNDLAGATVATTGSTNQRSAPGPIVLADHGGHWLINHDAAMTAMDTYWYNAPTPLVRIGKGHPYLLSQLGKTAAATHGHSDVLAARRMCSLRATTQIVEAAELTFEHEGRHLSNAARHVSGDSGSVSATMAEARGPAEDRYQLPEGTYRELIVKDRMTKFLKKRRTTLRKLQELRDLPEDKVEEARLQHAEDQARVKAAADQEVAAGRPIVVLAWQVQVTRYAHRLAAAPSGLTTPATATVRVFADDTCEPASF